MKQIGFLSGPDLRDRVLLALVSTLRGALFTGAYLGFDDTAPTCRSDGKATVVDSLIRRFQTGVIIVGDGMTDAKACPPATFFIGFGGNADRPPVRAATPYFCTTMQELLELFRSVGLVL
ncbi:hypothetical protein CRM22_006538 [Opisthorchis felineus]|uniref:Phosphoserine phosphatase n=1 Tax=Opisthorchis felineus TaxID=147828 RepID=A0A4S2LM67_OPIFE|nr:hypothetical protein CRM22_006538 [Opisthorchis felineus]